MVAAHREGGDVSAIELPALALSIMQPYCEAILALGKSIENRDWRSGCHYRGPLLLHASKGIGSRDDFSIAVEGVRACWEATSHGGDEEVWEASLGRRTAPDPKTPRWQPAGLVPSVAMELGGIVGMVDVVGVVRRCPVPYDRPSADVRDGAVLRRASDDEEAWWTGGFGLLLRRPRRLPFVACKGALGLWAVPSTVLDELRAAIAASAS
jgi:hypothetical protein